jgi:hypothetical protein
VRFGFYLPTRGPTATREGMLALAREGERLGLPLFDVAIPDRDASRRSFLGSAADIASDIRSLAAIGVHELILTSAASPSPKASRACSASPRK